MPAMIRPFVFVYPTVHFQFAFRAEKFPASLALMGLLPRVFDHVQFVMLLPPKSFRANVALEWVILRMRGHVHPQSLSLNESFPANLTNKRFNPRVNQQMLLVIRRVRKQFITNFALGLDNPLVNALYMPLKETFIAEYFPAGIALGALLFFLRL